MNFYFCTILPNLRHFNCSVANFRWFHEKWEFLREITFDNHKGRIVFLTNSEALNFEFGEFEPWKIAQFHQNQNSVPLKLAKSQF